MMKLFSAVLPLLILVSCENKLEVEKGATVVNASEASKICTGQTVAGIAGTANCTSGGGSASVTEVFYIFAARADAASLDFDSLVDALWTGANPASTREVATFQDMMDGSLLHINNYSVIPRPLDESDGNYATNSPVQVVDPGVKRNIPVKRHYLETIISNKTGGSRADIQVCGGSGSISARIEDCRSVNGIWSFYSGAQYGQAGEGDWSLVTVVDDAGTKYEVWRDERTKLLWSDRASSTYNWYQASGYSRLQEISYEETSIRSDPGSGENWDGTGTVIQPVNPISVCPDVVAGEIAAGGGSYTNYAANPETSFKGNLSISNDVIWKLPSIDDWKLADVNGIRKVLPNIEHYFWSSSSYSYARYYALEFSGVSGQLGYEVRSVDDYVRCVAFVRE